MLISRTQMLREREKYYEEIYWKRFFLDFPLMWQNLKVNRTFLEGSVSTEFLSTLHGLVYTRPGVLHISLCTRYTAWCTHGLVYTSAWVRPYSLYSGVLNLVLQTRSTRVQLGKSALFMIFLFEAVSEQTVRRYFLQVKKLTFKRAPGSHMPFCSTVCRSTL
jgi:hypothetical protein